MIGPSVLCVTGTKMRWRGVMTKPPNQTPMLENKTTNYVNSSLPLPARAQDK